MYSFGVEVRIIPFLSVFKKPFAYLIEIIDVTKIAIDERSVAYTKSIQKIAHDIKTPLSSIHLNLGALRIRLEEANLENNDIYFNDIDIMKSELDRVKNLTQHFLKFTNLEKPNLQALDFVSLVEKSISNFNQYLNNGLTIDTDFAPQIKNIWADPYQIEEVLNILIENAIDAVKAEGKIQIITNMAQDLMNTEKEFVQIEIIDNGLGISSENIEKLFDPYFTTKSEGTGLGLAIAKKIISDHGGEIEVHSRINLGTTFRFTLPLVKDEISK